VEWNLYSFIGENIMLKWQEKKKHPTIDEITSYVTDPVKVEPYRTSLKKIEKKSPLATREFKEALKEVEVDSRGHSIDRMRTTDPVDLIKVSNVVPKKVIDIREPALQSGSRINTIDIREASARPQEEMRSTMSKEEFQDKHTFSGGSNRLRIIRPFGPSIGEFLVREDILDASKGIVDYVYHNEYQDYTQQLAGIIEEEGYIPAKYWFPSGCGKYFEDAVASYLVESIASSMLEGGYVEDSIIEAQEESRPTVKTNSVWFNVMRSDEYNPIHYHTNCQVSGVYYLNVPDIPRRPEIKYGQDAMDGNILMIDCNNNPQINFCMGHVSKSPKEGMVYLFPSFMQHTVYPFKGPGERVSIAFNFSIEWGDKEIDPLIAARYRAEMGGKGPLKEHAGVAIQEKRALGKNIQ
jgi:hypothetical protein